MSQSCHFAYPHDQNIMPLTCKTTVLVYDFKLTLNCKFLQARILVDCYDKLSPLRPFLEQCYKLLQIQKAIC
uniref:Uncharacterized protein n=1 Tax=Arundo donax TaxID=35708 RepID=A0A0A9FK24_ARUDO